MIKYDNDENDTPFGQRVLAAFIGISLFHLLKFVLEGILR